MRRLPVTVAIAGFARVNTLMRGFDADCGGRAGPRIPLCAVSRIAEASASRASAGVSSRVAPRLRSGTQFGPANCSATE